MKPVLLCLHGWGGSKESFTELRSALAGTDLEILTPDLPGFGSEPEPDRPWTNDEYADWVVDWTNRQPGTANRQLFLLGHSHGGRIAIKLAALSSQSLAQSSKLKAQSFSHLFLCAPAGIRRPQPVKRFVAMILAKTGKWLLSLPLLFKYVQPVARSLFYRLLRTHDYEVASPMMRQTMVHVTSEDLRPLLKQIHIPTDIFWGTEDGHTPYADGLIVQSEIRGSVLHTYPGVRHGVHRDKAREIAEVIKARMEA